MKTRFHIAAKDSKQHLILRASIGRDPRCDEVQYKTEAPTVLHSMTAFASGQGQSDRFAWQWELRSVNGKGLDLRLRVPDWIDGLEAGLRSRLSKAVTRGNVTLSLRLQAEEQGGGLMLNEANLAGVLDAIATVEAQAMEREVTLAPANAASLLVLRGMLEPGRNDTDSTELCATLTADFEPVLDSFLAMRAGEGAALSGLLDGHFNEIARLTEAAADAAAARRPEAEAALRAALARVLKNADGVDEARLAQELALLAVKADITEEVGRLRAHVEAARALLAQGSPIGRKLDFLAQEFNREANTLCSKSQSAVLTGIGLELKSAIDQMREQVQNVE